MDIVSLTWKSKAKQMLCAFKTPKKKYYKGHSNENRQIHFNNNKRIQHVETVVKRSTPLSKSTRTRAFFNPGFAAVSHTSIHRGGKSQIRIESTDNSTKEEFLFHRQRSIDDMEMPETPAWQRLDITRVYKSGSDLQ